MTQKIAYGQCWLCPEWFWYGVLTVPSVAVDQAGRAIDDDGGTQVYRLAPICPKCVGEVNRERAANELALFPADTAQIPAGHLGPLDLPGVKVRTEWFVPTNGLPIPAHLVTCFDPECPGCIMDPFHEAVDEVWLNAPKTDDEDTLYENTLCPVAGLSPAVQAIPVRNAAESAEPTREEHFSEPGPAHVFLGTGTHAAYCWCRPGDARFGRETILFWCACGRSNPHAATEACR